MHPAQSADGSTAAGTEEETIRQNKVSCFKIGIHTVILDISDKHACFTKLNRWNFVFNMSIRKSHDDIERR